MRLLFSFAKAIIAVRRRTSTAIGHFVFATGARFEFSLHTYHLLCNLPLPEPTAGQTEAIAAAAKQLDTLRNNWLNPPEWMKTEILEFPGSVDGPWKRYVTNPNLVGIGTVKYPRLVAKDASAFVALKNRTLTQLYNERPTWLDNAHKKLDEAVFAAYGWPSTLTDDELLAKLLELNLARSQTNP